MAGRSEDEFSTYKEGIVNSTLLNSVYHVNLPYPSDTAYFGIRILDSLGNVLIEKYPMPYTLEGGGGVTNDWNLDSAKVTYKSYGQGYYTTITISGVTGSTPVCTKAKLVWDTSSTEWAVSGNAVTGTSPGNVLWYGSDVAVTLYLYDADSNEIASKSLTMTGTFVDDW